MSLLNILASFYGSGVASNTATPPVSISNIKDIQPADADGRYNAFGGLLTTGADRMTWIGRSGSIPPGTYAHLENGKNYQVHFTPSTKTWGTPLEIDTEAGRDLSDCNAITMDNGQHIYFSSIGPDLTNTIPATIYFRKAADNSLAWGARVNLLTDAGAINSPGALTGTQSGTVFGAPQAGDAPGEYYVCFVQLITNGGRYCVKTTDYWNTWTFYPIYTGTNTQSETAIFFAKGSGGKMIAVARTDGAGGGGWPLAYKSGDYGQTWTYMSNPSNLNYGYSVLVPHLFGKDGNVNLIYTDRDSGFIKISKNVFLDVYNTGNFATPELYRYIKTDGARNPSLGYTVVKETPTAGIYLVCFSKEMNDSRADLLFTTDDLQTDPAGIPIAPPSISFSATVNSIVMNITGYTQSQLDNVRWFKIDISTASDFSSFATLKIRHPSLAAILINDVVTPSGTAINLEQLPAGTTYYVRIKAVNNAGASAYTTLTVSTTGT